MPSDSCQQEIQVTDNVFRPRRSFAFDAVVAASTLCFPPDDYITVMELVSHGDNDGSNCRPSQLTLARDGCLYVPGVRRSLARMRDRGTIVHCGEDSRGIDVWRVALPKHVPEYVNRNMVQRAFQYHLKPLPRAIVICIAARADHTGCTHGHSPMIEDLRHRFEIGDDAIWRAQKQLLRLGLIRPARRTAWGTAFDISLGTDAMAWVPGKPTAIATNEKMAKNRQHMLSICSANVETAISPTRNRKNDLVETAISPTTTVSYHGQVPTVTVAPSAPPAQGERISADLEEEPWLLTDEELGELRGEIRSAEQARRQRVNAAAEMSEALLTADTRQFVRDLVQEINAKMVIRPEVERQRSIEEQIAIVCGDGPGNPDLSASNTNQRRDRGSAA